MCRLNTNLWATFRGNTISPSTGKEEFSLWGTLGLRCSDIRRDYIQNRKNCQTIGYLHPDVHTLRTHFLENKDNYEGLNL